MNNEESLTQEQLQDLEVYYNNFFSMFGTKGWEQLVESLTADAKNLNDLQAAKDLDDMRIKQGQLQLLAFILNFEKTCRVTWDGIFDNQRQDEQDAA